MKLSCNSKQHAKTNVTSTGCADSEEAAAAAALVVIKVEQNKHAAEWRDAS